MLTLHIRVLKHFAILNAKIVCKDVGTLLTLTATRTGTSSISIITGLQASFRFIYVLAGKNKTNMRSKTNSGAMLFGKASFVSNQRQPIPSFLIGPIKFSLTNQLQFIIINFIN